VNWEKEMSDSASQFQPRRWNRLLPFGSNSTAEIKDQAGNLHTVQVIDESVLGLGVQLSRFESLCEEQVIELKRGSRSGPAVVRAVRPYGIAFELAWNGWQRSPARKRKANAKNQRTKKADEIIR